jgi:hypothetical protein
MIKLKTINKEIENKIKCKRTKHNTNAYAHILITNWLKLEIVFKFFSLKSKT